MRVIAIEEHYSIPELREVASTVLPPVPGLGDILGKLIDLGEQRIAEMDAAGIDLQVLSVSSPSTQQIEPSRGLTLSKKANDRLAEAVQAHPDRFDGFATLPTSGPAAAADELERCVKDLGFKGALVNGHTGGEFLDNERFSPILERAEALSVPIYLHPTPPTPQVVEAYYSGLPQPGGSLLGQAAWGWHVETGLHALRMIVGGVFDRFPDLQIILGHMGEALPFMMGRLEDTLGKYAELAFPVPEYFQRNFWITTSALFTMPPLLCTLQTIGADRMIFSVDYPFSDNERARNFFDAAPLSPADREKIAHGNVERLLGLEP